MFPSKRKSYSKLKKGFRKWSRGTKTDNAKRIKSAQTSIATWHYPSLQRNYFKSHQALWPQQFQATLRGQTINAGSTASLTFTNVGIWPLNSAYSPTGSSGLTGITRMFATYSKAYVRAWKCTITLSNVTQTSSTYPLNTVPLYAGITATTLSTPVTFNDDLQNGLETHTVVGANPDTRTITLSCDVAKFVGRDDLLDSSDFYSTVSANPAQLVYAQFYINNINGGYTGYWQYQLVIEQDIVFSDPINWTT